MESIDKIKRLADIVSKNTAPSSNTNTLIGNLLKAMALYMAEQHHGAVGGYQFLNSLNDLPTGDLTDKQKRTGYVVGENIYFYVGTDGDTLDGEYQNGGSFHGTKGDDGLSAYEIWKAIPGNENKTIDNFWAFLTADKGYKKIPLANVSARPSAGDADLDAIYIYPDPNDSSKSITAVSNGMIWIELFKSDGNIRELEERLSAVEKKLGKTENTFEFSQSDNTYISRSVEYDFINGHRYKIHIEDDNELYTTYFSVRDESGNALQNNIGTGTGTRDIFFTCNENGGKKWYLTIREAHIQTSYDCYIVDLNVTNLYSIEYRVEQVESSVDNVLSRKFADVLDVGNIPDETDVVFSATGYYVDQNGELQEDTNNFWKMSNTFLLKKGESIKATLQSTTSNRPMIMLTDVGNTYYTAVAKSSSNDVETHLYTAENDCHVIMQSRSNSNPSVVIFADSNRLRNIEKSIVEIDEACNNRIGTIENVIEIESHDDVREITKSKTGHFIDVDGSVGNSNFWWQTNVFFLHKNERVSLVCTTTKPFAVVAALTDQQQSFYRPVLFGPNIRTAHHYTATSDCYVILQFMNVWGSIVISSDSGRIVALENKVSNLASSIDTVVDSLPQYVKDEEERVYGELLQRMNDDNIFIAFNTDQHFDLDYSSQEHSYNPKWVMQGIRALCNITNDIPLDLVVFGGDTVGYASGGSSFTVNGIIKTCNHLFYPLLSVNTPVVSIPGNHDAFQNNGSITSNAMYNVHYKRFESVNKARVHLSGYDNCDSYIDDSAHKIRYIFVDVFSGLISYVQGYKDREESYVSFLQGALSTLPIDYNAIIFSHNPLTDEFTKESSPIKKQSSAGVESDAFADPVSLNDKLDTYADRIIACICGHSHADVYAFSQSGILFIETTCAAAHARYMYDDIPYKATINSPTDTAFDFFVINLEDKTIEAIRYGQGTNRKWIYKGENAGLVSYENFLGGNCSVGSVTLTFTNDNDNTDIVIANVDANGKYEVYLRLGETYNISCDGYSIDTATVTLAENTYLDLELTENS